MIRKIFVFFFVGILSWQLLLPIPVMLDYALRYDTYSQELCENRFDPSSDCKGSCQITRILKGETQKQSEPSLPAFQMPKDWLPNADFAAEKPCFLSESQQVASLNLAAAPYQQPFLELGKKPPQILIHI